MLYKGAPPFSMSALYIIMNFNPRAPCGARLCSALPKMLNDVFQSTRPMRGATESFPMISFNFNVSIHAPHAGRDVQEGLYISVDDVSIHAPHAGRDALLFAPAVADTVSIHAPHAGRDDLERHNTSCTHVSIHAPRVGRDTPTTRMRQTS